jgi:predicted AAA+ superfamily ATPase
MIPILFNRDTYLNRLIQLQNQDVIKVITGVRRCGKSTLLRIFTDYLLRQGVAPQNIISLRLDDLHAIAYTKAEALLTHLETRFGSTGPYYVMLDEVQMVRDFPYVVNTLFLMDNVDVYITGSNSRLLSSELGTLLSGRYIEIAMMPLSFGEYYRYVDEGTSGRALAYNGPSVMPTKAELFQRYLEASSFPMAALFGLNGDAAETLPLVQDYLEDLYNSVILKDVVTRKGFSDSNPLGHIVKFLLDNIGNQNSLRSIAHILTAEGHAITVPTVEKYLTALIESHLFYRARRWNIKGKDYLRSQDKYYVVDIGIRRALLGETSDYADVGHILENVVFLELRRRERMVAVGAGVSGEVDFVTGFPRNTAYYQVAASILDPQTFAREVRPLESINDNYPKTLLTLDTVHPRSHKGIVIKNVLDFLLESNMSEHERQLAP